MLRLIAIALAAAGFGAVAASAPKTPERPTVEMQIAQAEREAAAAATEQQRLEALAGKARNDAARLHARQLAAAQGIAGAEARISAADAKARFAAVQLAVQKQQLARAQAPLRGLLSGLVLSARRPPAILLADAGSARDLVKLRVLIDSITPAIHARTAALKTDLDRAARLRQSAALAARDVRRGRDELLASRTAFAKLEAQALELAERRGTLALGAGDVAIARTEDLAGVREAATGARSAAARAAELAKLGPAPLPKADGAATRPPIDYRLPARAAVVDGLGEVSSNGVRSRGITLATRRGAALVVPADGTVVFAGPFRDYDGVIIIDHGRGWKSVLVNAGTRRTKGDRVRLGDPLGTALGPVEVQLHAGADQVSPALIAGSSAMLSNARKGG